MARTAPVPNFAAIPGMNPGLFVLGGGGDGGGSGAGGGKGKGKGQGAGGTNGGKDAKGGGKGAGACGAGTPAGQKACPGPHGGGGGNVAAGDPVDVVTGAVFTTPSVDLALPGPLPFRFVRSYNTQAREDDVGLGWGWSHSLAWSIRQTRRLTRLTRDDGTTLDFDALGPGESTIGPDGLVLARTEAGFDLEEESGVRRRFTLGAHSEERYDLASLSDAFGNTITLQRHEGRLASITDSAMREIRVETDAEGRLTGLFVRNALSRGQWLRRMSYRYDDEGHLVETTDAEGFRASYEYDEDHRLTRKVDEAGLAFSFVYDDHGRCVETWGAPPADLGLAEGVPAVLADGKTKARGVHHCRLEYGEEGYTEVTSSLEVERYFGNAQGKVEKAVAAGGAVHSRTYDAYGHPLTYTDPLGAVTSWTRDPRGRVLSQVDPLGRVTQYEREADGHLRSVTDPSGAVTTIERSGRTLRWTDPLGASWLFVHDERGLLVEQVSPLGGRYFFRHDVQGNCVERIDPLGRRTAMTYDGLGNLISETSPGGGTVTYRYNQRDELVAVRNEAGTRTIEYDGAGNIVASADATGGTTRYRYGGAHLLIETRSPSGALTQLRYDREGQLVTIENGRGERHTFVRGPRGAVAEERTFDGRVLRYRHDLCGRVIERQVGSGEPLILTYNACGELVERAAGDDVETFELDAQGELVRAETPAGVFTFERNAAGWILAERFEVGGEAQETKLEYDPMGSLVRRSTSAAGVVRTTEWKRDVLGGVLEVHIDGQIVQLTRDDAGRAVELRLPGGGRIERGYDALSRQTLERALAAGAGAPTIERLVAYDAADRPVSVRDGGDPTTFEYDAGGQLTAARRGQRSTTYGYDGAGNLLVTGGQETRAHGPGGRVERSNGTSYTWDEAGRLESKRSPSGTVHFRWKENGLLGEVVKDDSVVSFDYDPLARRVRKRVTRVEGGVQKLVSETRFLYDGAELVREIERRARDEGDPVVVERSYVYDDRGVPLAQRTDVQTGTSLRFVLADLTCAPVALVGPDGALEQQIERDAWGKLARPEAAAADDGVRLGFEGQYYDAETGLWSNRFRYYDPEIGRYISPDPVGLRGGLNAYRYAVNAPTYAVDPDGLMPYAIIRDKNGNKVATGQSAGHGGGVQPKDAAAISPEARPSCAETTALHELVKHLPPEQRRAEIQRLFNEKGYTIECWDGSAGDYKHQNAKSVPMNPCPYCKRMFNDLGIGGQVRAPNGGKAKVKNDGSPKGFERRVHTPWDGDSTSHD